MGNLAEDLYTQYLDTKREVVRCLCDAVSANIKGDAGVALDILAQVLGSLEKITKENFDSDKRRLAVRNNTIKYLQDKLAEK